MFGLWQSNAHKQRESDQLGKLNAGREAMLSAVASTTEVADGLVSWLKEGFSPKRDDALLLCEPDGRITSCNHAARSMFLTDTAQHSVKEFLYPDGDPLDKVWASIFTAASHSKTYMIGIRDGISFPAEVSVYRLERPAGQSTKVLMMVRDLNPKDLDEDRFDTTESVKTALQTIREHKVATAQLAAS